MNALRPRVAVLEEYWPEVRDVVDSLRGAGGWSVRFFSVGNKLVNEPAHDSAPGAVALRRVVVSTDGVEFSTNDEETVVEFWYRDEGEQPDSGKPLPRIRRKMGLGARLVQQVSPELWGHSVAESKIVDLKFEHVQQVVGPIDVVYTWVNGSDPEWLKRKAAAQAGTSTSSVSPSSIDDARFNDREELKHSLRSLEMYAPWVNHIYIVTDRQVPEWLDTDHPQITVVDHRDIFADTTVLPVFNSLAIESQIHRLPGLAEKYVYMNDDFFLMRPTEASLFFHGNGLAKFFPSSSSLSLSDPVSWEDPFVAGAKLNRRFIQNRFNRTITAIMRHTPQPQLKSVIQQMESEHPQIFSDTASSSFRRAEDYLIPSSLFHWYLYCIGRSVPGSIGYGYVNLSNPNASRQLKACGESSRLDALCINDAPTDFADAERISESLAEFFAWRFPFKSSFEK